MPRLVDTLESLLVKRFGPRAGSLYAWVGGPLIALGILAYGGQATLHAFERDRAGLAVVLGLITLGLLFRFARTLHAAHRSIRQAQAEK